MGASCAGTFPGFAGSSFCSAQAGGHTDIGTQKQSQRCLAGPAGYLIVVAGQIQARKAWRQARGAGDGRQVGSKLHKGGEPGLHCAVVLVEAKQGLLALHVVGNEVLRQNVVHTPVEEAVGARRPGGWQQATKQGVLLLCPAGHQGAPFLGQDRAKAGHTADLESEDGTRKRVHKPIAVHAVEENRVGVYVEEVAGDLACPPPRPPAP